MAINISLWTCISCIFSYMTHRKTNRFQKLKVGENAQRVILIDKETQMTTQNHQQEKVYKIIKKKGDRKYIWRIK